MAEHRRSPPLGTSSMKIDQFNEGLMSFLQASPTPFHAVQTMSSALKHAGFTKLNESSSWDQLDKGRYFVTRNDSSIIVFTTGNGDLRESGFRMVGAHTDSPCLKIKPNPETVKNNYFQLGVEVYGGVLLNPWFDRDLSIAGRIHCINEEGTIISRLIDFEKAVATIPSLAIHLDREANEKRTVNKQLHMPPILMQVQGKREPNFKDILLKQLHKSGNPECEEVLEYELCFYDTQPPAKIGLKDEFLTGSRMDNLLSCYIGLMAIMEANEETPTLLVCTDHEEVGSASICGAQGPFLKSVLERLGSHPEDLTRTLTQSMMISVDNAHGIHPNYSDKHDNNHGPILNHGPVIKTNANQRYATNSETSAIFKRLCRSQNVTVQDFVVRSDMACGSTIGPITASEIGVRTIDIGIPQFAMHSIREIIGCKDPYALYKVLKAFNQIANLPLSTEG